jgi:outer membrane protein assembly factor BamA
MRLLIGARFSKYWIYDYTGSYINGGLELPTLFNINCTSGAIIGCGGGFDNYIKLGVTYDSRDFEPDPTEGFLAEISSEFSTKLIGSAFNYGRVTTSVHTYNDLFRYNSQLLIFAGRLLYSFQFGDVPVYTMDTLSFTEKDRMGLGGLRTLRGFIQDRFIGPASMLLDLELRYTFLEFTLFDQYMKLGIVPFFDAGNAYNNVSSTTLAGFHLDGGAGLRLSWNLSTIIIFDYGFSEEDSAFYLDIQHQF